MFEFGPKQSLVEGYRDGKKCPSLAVRDNRVKPER
jgi:hypothetical protein